mgnify:CR=1 FL=1
MVEFIGGFTNISRNAHSPALIHAQPKPTFSGRVWVKLCIFFG